MKTVIQVVQHMQPGGIETMVLDLAKFCEQHEKTIIVSLEGDHKSALTNWPRLQPFADKMIFLNKQSGVQISLIFKLKKLFKKLNADVIHTHHIGPLLYAGIAARLASVKCLIHTEHDAWHLQEKKRRNLQRWVIRIAKPLLIADAETVADAMRNHLSNNNIHIIRNGIDTKRFIPGNKAKARLRLELPQDAMIVGCSGRLEEVKGHKNLIYAMALLPSTVHLALAGSGSLENSLQHLVKALGLDERIHFLGRIDDMPSFYQALNVFCLPSLNEGFPLSPLEAQACNIATVVTDVGGSRETLCPQSGKLVPANNYNFMASTLTEMLKQKSKINSRTFVQQHGNVRRMAKAYSVLRYAGA